MLCQINYLMLRYTCSFPILFQVDRGKLITHFGCELTVVQGTKVDSLGADLAKEVEFVFEFALIIKLAVKLAAFILGPLLPPVLIEAVLEH